MRYFNLLRLYGCVCVASDYGVQSAVVFGSDRYDLWNVFRLGVSIMNYSRPGFEDFETLA